MSAAHHLGCDDCRQSTSGRCWLHANHTQVVAVGGSHGGGAWAPAAVTNVVDTITPLIATLRARVAELEAQLLESRELVAIARKAIAEAQVDWDRFRAALEPNDPDLVADYAEALGHLEWDAPAVAYVDALLAAIRKRAGLDRSPP